MHYSLRIPHLVTQSHFYLENANICFKSCLNVLSYDFHLLYRPWIHNEYAKKVGKISFHLILKEQASTGNNLKTKKIIKNQF